MGIPSSYQIDRTKIIFEQFEDETVLIDTQGGYYYSLSPSGTEILHLLEDGCPDENLPQALFGDSGEVSQLLWIVANFVRRLIDEGIVIARASGYSALPSIEGHPPLFPGGLSFTPPVIERFDEVRDLLLIDPIHQVDQDYGWPKAQANG
jgi:hypothetical protein